MPRGVYVRTAENRKINSEGQKRRFINMSPEDRSKLCGYWKGKHTKGSDAMRSYMNLLTLEERKEHIMPAHTIESNEKRLKNQALTISKMTVEERKKKFGGMTGKISKRRKQKNS